jgi:glycosyltransferase involved in cell wall biosynthesis
MSNNRENDVFMKILYQTRYNIFSRKGGDTTQILKTKEYIEKLYPEVSIDINNDPQCDLSNYDLVHIFNLLRPQETLLFVDNAQKQNKKIALSTIYWKDERFEKKGQVGFRKIINNFLSYNSIERIRALYRYYVDGEKHIGTKQLLINGFKQSQKYIIDNVDILLPNGQGEIDLLIKEFNLKEVPKYIVVPNAIDPDIFKPGLYKKEDLILCVGRIEPRKNQLNLVKALSGLNMKVLLVGKVHETQKSYYKKIQDIIKKSENISIIDEINPEELALLYKKAKVHVLPSWYDTPGLVSLEAGINNCNIVVTDRGTTQEYFEDNAYYCDPENIKSIRNAVLEAFSAKSDFKLAEKIKDNYTWKNTAQKTMLAYKLLLDEEQNKI